MQSKTPELMLKIQIGKKNTEPHTNPLFSERLQKKRENPTAALYSGTQLSTSSHSLTNLNDGASLFI